MLTIVFDVNREFTILCGLPINENQGNGGLRTNLQTRKVIYVFIIRIYLSVCHYLATFFYTFIYLGTRLYFSVYKMPFFSPYTCLLTVFL